MSKSITKSIRQFVITDVNNVEHYAVLAGILEVNKYDSAEYGISVTNLKGKRITTQTTWTEPKVLKNLYLGLSITNPTDNYDPEKGIMIAEGRTLKPSKRIMEISSESRGALGKEMVDAIMTQQIDFIQQNYGLFMQVKKIETIELPF